MRITTLTLFLACATTVAGCSSLRPYDAARDRQGQAARQAWSEVNLKETIDAERANLTKLLAAEIETQQQLARAIRGHALRSLVRGDSLQASLVSPLDTRFTALAGTRAALDNAQTVRGKWNASRDRVVEKTHDLASQGLAAPACAQIVQDAQDVVPPAIRSWQQGANSQRSKDVVESALRILRRECRKNLSENDVYKSFGGAISIAWEEYLREAQRLDEQKKQLGGLEARYREARAAYEKASAEARSEPALQAQAEAAAKRVQDVVSLLEQSKNPYAARLLADERLQAIGELAQAITEAQPGQAATPGPSENVRTLALLPGIADDVRAALAAARKPLALPLVIRKNHEELNLEAARRDIAVREEIVRLSHELVLALYEQAQQLALASDELARARELAREASKPSEPTDLYKHGVAAAFSEGKAEQREALYGAAARYLDALNRLDARRYTLAYRRIAARHEQALAYAEVGARQWQSLIGVSVEQVADYGASGFKPEQIAGFLNTLGLLSIGVGVNK